MKIEIIGDVAEYYIQTLCLLFFPGAKFSKKDSDDSHKAVVTVDNVSYYVMGDTDETTESKCVSCDVLFIPVGGKFTMDKDEARHLTLSSPMRNSQRCGFYWLVQFKSLSTLIQ